MRRFLLCLIFILFGIIVFSLCIKISDAASYNGTDIALAILADPSTLVSSHYEDSDTSGQFRQRAILDSLGVMFPTDGDTFALLSTGIAGATPVTSNSQDPGSERGTWFGAMSPGPSGPFDRSKLILTLNVPPFMHNLSLDLQFFSMEYPDYVGSIYNDKVTVTVYSPSKGTTSYTFDVNSGDFVFKSRDIPGTGFDLFAVRWSWWQGDWVPTSPSGVDTVTTTPYWSDDAGASALITRQFPVSPNETITVIFEIRDVGDNQFDSAVFIDNVRFTGYGFTQIRALKTWQDLNGDTLEPGDRIRYRITISNSGVIAQPDNPGNEFEDYIPENTTFVPGSLYASSGTASYIASENKIVWNGEIPGESSVLITYDVDVSSSIQHVAAISNQGVVYWDENEDGINEKTELTDDPTVDDGIDLDGDGETGDDDPTIAIVLVEDVSELIEDFSDDTRGGAASQSYYGLSWFITSTESGESSFEVAGGYYYSTSHSFKVQLRSTAPKQYWNYSFGWISSEPSVRYWEVMFACGNNSEESDLFLSFKNLDGDDIAKIKIEYVQVSDELPDLFAPALYYWDNGAWKQLNSDYQGGYLYNGWYKLRLEAYGDYINYSLYRNGYLTDEETGYKMNVNLTELSYIEWYSTRDAVVCPMFFFDEHKVGFD